MLGTAIKELREASGLTRVELAQRAGISTVFMGKIEQGARRPSLTTLAGIAGALQVTAGELRTRAALLDASGATTDEEMKRRLIRAAAVGAGGSVALAPLLASVGLAVTPFGGTVAAVGVVAAFARKRRAQREKGNENDTLSDLSAAVESGTSTARQQLLRLIDELSDEEAAAVLLVAQQLASPDAESSHGPHHRL